ncbi:MAG: exonuclease domain-containing protein [Firmicutes bacterium]|nr:exonuclease domain-containing protein [Bacillota bacterium]
MKTGFADLDRCIGKINNGELIILAGRPAMGKTTLTMEIIRRCQKAVLYIAMEQLFEKHRKSLEGYSVFIKEYYFSVGEIRRLIKTFKSSIEFIVISNMQSLDTGWSIKELKQLAQELNVPILALFQIKRRDKPLKNFRPVIKEIHIRHREQLAYADRILLLHRNDYYVGSDESTENIVEIIICRNIGRPTGIVFLKTETNKKGLFFYDADENEKGEIININNAFKSYLTALTYGLTSEENKQLKRHSSFIFEDVSGCFSDLLAREYLAAILNPEKLSNDEIHQLFEVCFADNMVLNELLARTKNENNSYVAIDIETTGLFPFSDKIIELGAVKIVNGEITEEYNQLINPQITMPQKITSLTGITNEMVYGMPTIEEALPQFLEFCTGNIIVAHNAKFDMDFIKFNSKNQGLKCDFEVLNTFEITRLLFPDLLNHRLSTVAKHLEIQLANHHSASEAAKATAQVFLYCKELYGELLKLYGGH